MPMHEEIELENRLALSVPEAAHVSSLSKSGVYNLINSGHLPARRVPGMARTLILRADLERFLEELPTVVAQ